MKSFYTRTAALLITGFALTAGPSFAQRDGRQNGGERGRSGSEQRAEPRRGGDSRGRVESYRGQDNRGYGSRSYDGRSFGNRSYDNRSFRNRSFGNRSFGYPSYGHRSYVLPYGYRPYGYRPGWNLDLYFGRPYYGYGYPGYGSAGYGYYSLAPGHAYGAVRIVDAPRDAQVFVDGNYAGVVDDYDGVFQHLNLEAGPHHIEIENEGYAPITFDVRVEPGQTITCRAGIR